MTNLNLDIREQNNFNHYLLDFYEKNEISLKALILSEYQHYKSLHFSLEQILNATSKVLAATSKLYNHLDKKRFPVQDAIKFQNKCLELAKVLLKWLLENLS